jgi:hypothetical protein
MELTNAQLYTKIHLYIYKLNSEMFQVTNWPSSGIENTKA